MTEVPKPGLVAVDGNGTLLREDGGVSEYTRDIVEQVQAQGIPVVLVTGRPLEKAMTTLVNAGMKKYVVTENGARAVSFSNGEVLYEQWLSGPDVAKPIQCIKDQYPGKCFFAQLTKEGGLIEEAHPWLQSEELRPLALKLFQTVVPSVVEALHADRQCAKSYVTIPSAIDIDATMRELKVTAGEGWCTRHIKQLLPGITNTCELQSVNINKADGLSGLCHAIGVPLKNVWAFGDDSNDIRMLSEVGWGVRMVNHNEGLVGIGKDMTEFSNEEDGVARYLERNLLRTPF